MKIMLREKEGDQRWDHICLWKTIIHLLFFLFFSLVFFSCHLSAAVPDELGGKEEQRKWEKNELLFCAFSIIFYLRKYFKCAVGKMR